MACTPSRPLLKSLTRTSNVAESVEPKQVDLAIIGAGPAGLAASVYASRYRINHAVIGPELGGYVSTTHLVEDYLGFASVSGMDLANHFVDHAKAFGAEIILDKINGIEREDGGRFHLQTWNGDTIIAGGLVLATGTEHKKIGKPGEDTFEGRGVSYCVTCDAAFFKDKPVAIVGGGDSGAKGVLHLSEFASTVYWIHRRSEFRAEPIWVERVRTKANVVMVLENEIASIDGEQTVTGVTLTKPFEGKSALEVAGVFVEIGSNPDRTLTNILGTKTEEDGTVIVSVHQRTSVENVWAAGDNTTASAVYRQIGTAAAEGAIAAGDIYEYFNDDRKDWFAKEGKLIAD